jgi:hypothetical protein
VILGVSDAGALHLFDIQRHTNEAHGGIEASNLLEARLENLQHGGDDLVQQELLLQPVHLPPYFEHLPIHAMSIQ